MLCRRAEMLPIECIVRGYITGSAWKEYRADGTMHGERLPEGLLESSQLPEPVFTPSTKAEDGDHDMNISFEQAAELVGSGHRGRARDVSLELYTRGAAWAAERGIIIADTKFELGFIDDELVLADEVLTPDSSRFWPADAWKPGSTPPSFDKQPVRDYLDTLDWDKKPPPPPLPAEVVDESPVAATSRRTSASPADPSPTGTGDRTAPPSRGRLGPERASRPGRPAPTWWSSSTCCGSPPPSTWPWHVVRRCIRTGGTTARRPGMPTLGAESAVKGFDVDDEHPWSLSPVRLAPIPAGTKLVLPSPNGAALAFAAREAGALVGVIAGCLRNAPAVGRSAAASTGRPYRRVGGVGRRRSGATGPMRPRWRTGSVPARSWRATRSVGDRASSSGRDRGGGRVRGRSPTGSVGCWPSRSRGSGCAATVGTTTWRWRPITVSATCVPMIEGGCFIDGSAARDARL